MSPEHVTLLWQSALVFGLAFAAFVFLFGRLRFAAMSESSGLQRLDAAIAKALARRDTDAVALLLSRQPLEGLRAEDLRVDMEDGSEPVYLLAVDPARVGALLARLPERPGLALAPQHGTAAASLLARARRDLGEPGEPDAVPLASPDQSKYLDPETGVLKAERIGSVFARFIRRARTRKKRVVVMQVVMDQVPRLEAMHGAELLPVLLRHVSEVLQRNLRERDLIARLDRSEFAVCMESDEAGGAAAAQRLLRVIRETPCLFHDAPLHVTASIGFAVEPTHARSVPQLFEACELASADARRLGGGHAKAFHRDLMRSGAASGGD